MPYTADKPTRAPSAEELRRTIPGWGVDLDPQDRPAVPKEIFNRATGAHWDFPERQPELAPREKSTEHKFLTPVFGTAQPMRGLSGIIRRYAYTYSEGRLAHWLLLVGADRVDVLESRVEALLAGRPDNPIAETGIMSEFRHHGYRSRAGRGRADLKHQPIDALLFMAPYLAIGTGLYMAARSMRR